MTQDSPDTARTMMPPAIGAKQPQRGGVVITLLLVAYFATKPFYIFPCGGPQIADGFVLVLFALTLSWRVVLLVSSVIAVSMAVAVSILAIRGATLNIRQCFSSLRAKQTT